MPPRTSKATTSKPKPRTRRAFGHLRQLPSDRFQAKYIGPDLKEYRAPLTFATKTDAEGWLAAERRLIDLDAWISPDERDKVAELAEQEPEPELTFRQYAEQALAGRKLAPRTRDLYEGSLRLYIYPVFGDMPLSEITPADVVRWHNDLDSIPSAQANAYGLLKSILKEATEAEPPLIFRNPCKIDGGSQANPVHEFVVLTPAELEELAAAMPEELGMAVLLAGWCLLRRGELFELRRRDVIENGAKLRVSRSVWERNGRSGVKAPKNGTPDSVIVPVHIREALNDHLAKFVGPGRDALLFPDPVSGDRMKEWTFRKIWRAATETIGREGLRLHELRHTGGTLTAQAGGTLSEIMARGRWKSAKAAMKYQHRAQGRDEVVAANLSAMARQSAS